MKRRLDIDEKVYMYRRKHKKCKYCRYLQYNDLGYHSYFYCRALRKVIKDDYVSLPRLFCSCFDVRGDSND